MELNIEKAKALFAVRRAMCDYCHDNITMNRLLAVCEDSPAEIPYYVRMVADNM